MSLIPRDAQNTNGIRQMLDSRNSRVSALLDVLLLEFLDETGLERSSSSLEFRGVDGGGSGAWSEDGGGGREDGSHI